MSNIKDDPNEIFSLFVSYPSCAIVQSLPYDNRCRYVTRSSDCHQEVQYVNYIEMLYCTLAPHDDVGLFIAVSVLMSICMVYFLILGSTADRIFCPALRVVSKKMGMSEHLAGVTLLAFGNGSPDLIETFSDINEPGRILLGDLLGAAVYVVSVIAGLIFLSYPFKLDATNILRDTCFFLLSTILIDYSMVSDGHVTVVEAALITSIYLVYLTVILLDQFFVVFSYRILQKRMQDPKYQTARNIVRLEQLRLETTMDIVDHTSRVSIDVESTRKMSYNEFAGANTDLLDQLIQSLVPISNEEWEGSGRLIRLYCICKAPIVFLLLLMMPVVDYELDRHGWSKLLNCIQISTFPIIVIDVMLPDIQYWSLNLSTYSLIFTVPISIYVFVKTRTDIPPTYHYALAIYPTLGSVVLIYICTGEVVNILNVVGIVTYSTESFLAATVQSWGNSIGDMVSTLSMARAGYPRMAIAACFGGPFFNSVVAIGGTFLINAVTSDTGYEKSGQGSQCENCVIFLMISLASVLIWSVSTDFDARRSIGIFYCLLYAVFLVFAVLGEAEIIETYEPEYANIDSEAIRREFDD